MCVSSYKYGDGLKDAKGHGADTREGSTRGPADEGERAEERRARSQRGGHGHELGQTKRGPGENAGGGRRRRSWDTGMRDPVRPTPKESSRPQTRRPHDAGMREGGGEAPRACWLL